MVRYAIFIALLLSAAMTGCGTPPSPPKPSIAPLPPSIAIAKPALTLTPVDFTALPGWLDDSQSAALPALRASCEHFIRQSDAKPVGPNAVAGHVVDWRPPCAALAGLSAADNTAVREFIEAWFRPYLASNNGEASGLFTGYYEPELYGSWTRTAKFAAPIYHKPNDLVTVELGDFRADWSGLKLYGRLDNGSTGGRLRPYYTRAEIEAGALAGKGAELLYISDKFDGFITEIQGSARVMLPDGGAVEIGYAAQNGHEYVPIGRDLIRRGILTSDTASMQSIRAWLESHPTEANAEMALNPSYVFFRVLDGPDGNKGPVGAMGAVLTPGRSLAVDPGFIALGAPLWLDIDDPREASGHLRRLVVADDTGGAIKGPVRGDLFWGTGSAAGARAGTMKNHGRYFMLLPRSVAERRDAQS